MRAALGRGDAVTLERTAHTLKGSCGKLGARKMAETARLLEEAGRRDDLSGAPGLPSRLYAEFEEAREEFSSVFLKG